MKLRQWIPFGIGLIAGLLLAIAIRPPYTFITSGQGLIIYRCNAYTGSVTIENTLELVRQ